MAAEPKKKNTRNRTVAEDTYSELEMYCIWLNEYYKGLRKAGFTVENALWFATTKESYPGWVKYGNPTPEQIEEFLEDEDE